MKTKKTTTKKRKATPVQLKALTKGRAALKAKRKTGTATKKKKTLSGTKTTKTAKFYAFDNKHKRRSLAAKTLAQAKREAIKRDFPNFFSEDWDKTTYYVNRYPFLHQEDMPITDKLKYSSWKGRVIQRFGKKVK